MNTGLGLFSNFGKKAKDLLPRAYLSEHKFFVSTTSVTRVALASTATKKAGVPNGDVGAVYKHNNLFIGVKFDAQSNITMTLTFKEIVPSIKTIASFKLDDFKSSKIATTLTFTEIVPSTKTIASFKLPDFKSGKLEVQYFHHHATLTSSVALNQAPTIDLSATVGTPTFAMGAKAGYETSTCKLTKFTVGISVNIPDSSASIVLGDKGDMITATYIHYFDVLKKTAAAGEFTRRLSTNKTSFTVGGCFAIDDQTVVKAKLNNRGKLCGLVQHKMVGKSLVTLSSEVDTKALHKTPNFGLALALKP